MASIYPNKKEGKIVSFKFKAFLGRDECGKQIFKCKTWTPEKTMSDNKLIALAEKEALVWERMLINEISENKRHLTPANITLESFVQEIWMPYQKSVRSSRPSTIDFYSYILKIALPQLGNKKLLDISEKDIKNYLDYLKQTYKTKKNTSLSPKTMRHHYATLNLIFEHAVKNDYVPVNPLAKIDSPKLTKHKVDSLSAGEVSVLIREIQNLPLRVRVMYMLLLTTGIRRGECFGIQWGDIDFDSSVINIQRNVTYSSGGIVVGHTKTATGERTIPMTSMLSKLLKTYCENENDIENAFLFHVDSMPHSPQDPTYITKHMKKFMKRIGLPDMSPHDLRHTCASLLIQNGADIKSVQDILGHADASTTLNFYARSDMNGMRKAVEGVFGE